MHAGARPRLRALMRVRRFIGVARIFRILAKNTWSEPYAYSPSAVIG